MTNDQPEGSNGVRNSVNESANKLRPSPFYDKGDLTIVSSDQMVFKVDSVYFRAFSSVVRDMLLADNPEPGSELKLEMEDPKFETSYIIDTVLDLMTGRSAKPLNYYRHDVHLGALLFARKWDCPQITMIVRLRMLAWLDRPTTFAAFFWRAGAILDDLSLCKRAIECIDESDRDDSDANPEDGICDFVDGDLMDITLWSLDEFSMVPPTYMWALTRTYNVEDPHERAREFEQLILAARSRASKLGQIEGGR